MVQPSSLFSYLYLFVCFGLFLFKATECLLQVELDQFFFFQSLSLVQFLAEETVSRQGGEDASNFPVPSICLSSKQDSFENFISPIQLFLVVFRCISNSYSGQQVSQSVHRQGTEPDFHCVGASGLSETVHGTRDVIYFSKAMTDSFQTFIPTWGGGSSQNPKPKKCP